MHTRLDRAAVLSSKTIEPSAETMTPTYPKAIYKAVFNAGILSHAGMLFALSNMGLLNDKQIKLNVKRMVTSGQLAKYGASYVLSETYKTQLTTGELAVYNENYLASERQREAKAREKEAGKLREEMRVTKAFKAAQQSLKGDRAALRIGLLAGL